MNALSKMEYRSTKKESGVANATTGFEASETPSYKITVEEFLKNVNPFLAEDMSKDIQKNVGISNAPNPVRALRYSIKVNLNGEELSEGQ